MGILVGGMGTPLFSCVSTEKLAAVVEAALSGRWQENKKLIESTHNGFPERYPRLSHSPIAQKAPGHYLLLLTSLRENLFLFRSTDGHILG
jgi:hypothetical protein